MKEHLAIACVLIAALWLVAAALRGAVPLPFRARAMWVLVFTGVPLLGWLTMYWGPTAGLVGCGAGVALLVWPPRRLFGTATDARPQHGMETIE